jgi:hypothetical protein
MKKIIFLALAGYVLRRYQARNTSDKDLTNVAS